MAEKAAEEQNKKDKKAVEQQAPKSGSSSSSSSGRKSAEEKSEEKRSDNLAEAFPGTRPDPGPEPRPPLELSKEQKKEAEDVRELQVKALEDNAVNVPGHEVVEVLAHSPGKGKNDDDDVRAFTFLNVGGEVVMHVDKAGDVFFNREEFHQLVRAVSKIGGTL